MPKSVMLFIPTMWDVPTSMSTYLMKVNSKYKIEVITTSKVLIHSARNLAIEKMIEHNSDYLIMIDSDNPCKYDNFVDVMVDNHKDIVSWIVRLRNRQEDLNICFEQVIEWMKAYINYQNIEWLWTLEEIGNCGSWLVCLSRKVCEDMIANYPRPFENKYTYYIEKEAWWYVEFWPSIFRQSWFKTNEQGWLNIRGRELSEDYLFFERAQSLGYKLYADTRLICKHLADQKFIEV